MLWRQQRLRDKEKNSTKIPLKKWLQAKERSGHARLWLILNGGTNTFKEGEELLLMVRIQTWVELSKWRIGWKDKQMADCYCSIAKSCLTLSNPMDCSTSGIPVYLPEFAQTHVHWVGDPIQPSHPLSFPSPPALNLSQHQGLFQWVGTSHQVPKLLELQLQHQYFQWMFKADFL